MRRNDEADMKAAGFEAMRGDTRASYKKTCRLHGARWSRLVGCASTLGIIGGRREASASLSCIGRPPVSRIFSRPDFLAGARDMTPPLLGLLPFGLVCGVGAQAAGASVLESFGLSALMFSGAAQILATQLMAAGAPVAVTILTCFVVGLRFLMYSAAMAPHLRALPPRWRHALAFVLTDQSFAAAIRRFRDVGGPAQRRVVSSSAPACCCGRRGRSRASPATGPAT